LVEVARVIKPQGLRGDVGVLMLWEGSDLLLHVRDVVVRRANGTEFAARVERIARAGKGWRIAFEGYASRDSAELLRGAGILVERAQFPAPAAGEVYLLDFVQAAVEGPDGVVIGEVVEVLTYPSCDAFVIKLLTGELAELAVVDDWVSQLDSVGHRVRLVSLDGLVTQ